MVVSTKISLRIVHGDEIALGPGKADLLQGIKATGSIAAAGRELSMSYKRAWSLVETMNKCFNEPLVETMKGGAQRGGAKLTPLGEKVLDTYRQMQSMAEKATARDFESLQRFLAD